MLTEDWKIIKDFFSNSTRIYQKKLGEECEKTS